MRKCYHLLWLLAALLLPAALRAQCDAGVETCTITVTGEDAYNDGWDGATLNIMQGSAAVGTFTVEEYDGTKTSTFTVCQGQALRFTWTAASGNLTYPREISFTIKNGDNSVIFTCNEGDASGWSTGDVLAEATACPTCLTPSAPVVVPDSNSAVLSWTAGGTESQWLVALDGGTEQLVSSATQSFSGLLPNTTHTYSVRAYCTPGDTSSYLRGTFRTTCGRMAIPYVEDFSGTADGAATLCWNPVVSYSSSSWYGTTVYPSVSNGELVFMSGDDSVLIATSAVPLAGNSIKVQFDAKVGSSYYSDEIVYFKAGVMTNPADPTTFIPLISRVPGDDFEEMNFTTSSLDATATYYVAFCFKAEGSWYSSYAEVHVDNVNIRPDDGCNRVQSARVESVSSDDITLSWVADGVNSTHFVVAYRPVGASAWTVEDAYSDTSLTIHNLATATKYSLRVGTVCNTDTLWLATEAKTACSAITVPYYAGFEQDDSGEEPSCWTRVMSYSYNSYWDGTVLYPSVSTDYASAGNNSLAFRGTDTNFIVSPALPVSGNGVFVEFAAYGSGIEAGISTGIGDASQFTPYVTTTGTGWQNYEFSSRTFDADTTYYLAFRYAGTSSYTTLYVDEVNVTLDNGCHRVASVVVDSTTSSEIYLHWIPNGENSSDFVVAYQTPGQDEWTVENAYADTAFTIYNAIAATAYRLRVGTVCGDDTLWLPATATTLCDIIEIDSETPYFQDFDAYADDVMPVCWDYDATYHTHYDGGCMFRTNAQNATAPVLLPQFSEPVSSLIIGFKGKLTPCDGIEMGVATASGDSIFWTGDTLSLDGQSQGVFLNYEYNFSNYQGELVRIAMRSTNTGSCPGVSGPWSLIDDVTVSVAAACLRPTGLAVHNQANEDSTYFTWENGAGCSQFQVLYDTISVELDDIATSPITVSDTAFLIPAGQLVRGGKYMFYVRSVCGSDRSEWRPIEFACGEVVMPESGTDTVIGCGFVVYDNGGAYSSYHASTRSTVVLKPYNTADRMAITGGDIRLYSGTTLDIYDGEGTDGDVLFHYDGDNTIFVLDTLITGEDGPMTVVCDAGSSIAAGYELFISCIPAPPCRRPQNLAVTVVDARTAYATWSGNAANYDVYYRAADSAAWTKRTVATDSVFLGTLAPETSYELYVQGICSNVDSSTATNPASFTMPASCFFNGDMSVIVGGTDNATLSWSGNAPSYRLRYREAGAQAWADTVVNDSVCVLTGLVSGTTYDVQLRGLCAADDSTSSSLDARFTTSCLPYDLTAATPLVEDFESADAPANCFLAFAATGNGNSVAHSTSAAYSGSRSFRFSSFNEASVYDQYLVSPMLNASGDIEVMFRHRAENASYPETFAVGYSLTGADPTDFTWGDTVTDATTAWTLYADTLPAAKYVAIHYFATEDRYYLYVDSLSLAVATLTVCPEAVLTAVAPDVERITIQFTADTAVEVLVTDGVWDSEAAGTIVAQGEGSYTFSGLQPATAYTVGVRQVCAFGVSQWTLQQVTTLDAHCVAPSALAVSDVTFEGATLGWTAGGEESRWEVSLFNTTTSLSFTAQEPSYTLIGLTPGVAYSVAVRALCGESGTILGPWSDTVEFTTDVCQPVGNVSVSVDGNKATVSWAAGSNSNGNYRINYGLGGFGTGEGVTLDVEGTTATIENLERGDYDLYVASVCADGIASVWSGVSTFTVSVDGIDAIGDAAVSLYPNPATDAFTVGLAGAGEATVSVIDLNGREVLSVRTAAESVTISVATLARGTYFVKVAADRVLATRKLVVR